VNSYKARWGSVRRACELVARFHDGKISREELLRGSDCAKRKALPLDLRWKVLKRDRYRCCACGKSPANDSGVELEIDHIVPVAEGGTNDESNLRVLCSECNREKGSGS
jgi:hypothetical protein